MAKAAIPRRTRHSLQRYLGQENWILLSFWNFPKWRHNHMGRSDWVNMFQGNQRCLRKKKGPHSPSRSSGNPTWMPINNCFLPSPKKSRVDLSSFCWLNQAVQSTRRRDAREFQNTWSASKAWSIYLADVGWSLSREQGSGYTLPSPPYCQHRRAPITNNDCWRIIAKRRLENCLCM